MFQCPQVSLGGTPDVTPGDELLPKYVDDFSKQINIPSCQ